MLSRELKDILITNKDTFQDIIGQEHAKSQLKSALLSDRHIIIIGPPGIGKTTLAKNVARILPEIEVISGCKYHCEPKTPTCPECKNIKTKKIVKIKGINRFVRIQGSQDLTVEDLLGDIEPIKALKFGALSIEAFTPGKIFKANRGVLFFDELNRCPEKLQNSLLQVLEEGKATIGSYDVDIETNFIFIGTMNIEDVTTERMSSVFMDRFDIIYMSYPEDIEKEIEIVLKNGNSNEIIFPEDILNTTIGFVRNLRDSDKLSKKPSVRASIGLYERACSNALLKNKKVVSLADVIEVIISVISHRIELKPSIKYLKSPEEFLKEETKNFFESKDIKDKEGDFL